MVVIACLVGIAVAVGTSSGAIAGAASLVTGLLVETLLVLHGTRKIRRGLRERRDDPDDVPLHYREILRVAAPLMVSSYAWSSVRPLINSILGRLPDPELAQGGFGVVIPLLLVTCSPLWALQNVTLILPGSRADLRRVVRFSAWVTVFFAGLIAIINWTPLRSALLQGVFSLSPEMQKVVAPAMLLIVLEPIFLATRSASQGLLIKARRTGIFAAVSFAKIALMAAVGLALVERFPTLNGVMLGTGLFISGELFDGLFYSLRARSLLLGGVLFPKVAAGKGETP
jgi:Na+-driven multidrug efflux pump